jgi:hypothetical protein
MMISELTVSKTYDRGGFHNVVTPADTMHTYALNWTKEATTWLIDGTPVRTVKFADAVDGKNYPQTPMNIRLGNWIAGAPNNSPGTIKWAGGIADMTHAPYNMYVESVKVKNYNPSDTYHYTDLSGSWQSIKYQVNTNESAPEPAAAPQPAGSAPAEVASPAPQPAVVTINPQGASKAMKSPCASNAAGSLTAAAALGVVTITPKNGTSNDGRINNGLSANATQPTFTIGVVSIDVSSSTLVSSASSSVAVAAAATTPSAVVTFALGNGTINATSTPLQVTTNDAVSRTAGTTAVALLAGLSALVVMIL